VLRNPRRECGQFHAVRFYESREALAAIVADFMGDGIIAGDPALLVATPGHRLAIETELRARRFDVRTMRRSGEFVALDAVETLNRFMVDGMPDADRFLASMRDILRRIAGRRHGSVIRVYGEMVDVLWRDAQEVAAIRLEMLWNKLAATEDFALLCGYSMGSFYKDAGLEAIRNQHTHILSPEGAPVPVARPA
jgi:superfamily I DNA/RNA helicase